jgi:hypothetical protein
MTPLRALLTAAGFGLALAGAAGADGTELRGSVGPGFAISLQDGSGAAVTHLDTGTFTLVVDDKSSEHNFHLQGPGGVDVSTDVAGTGTRTFSVTLVNGKYTFVCDPHAGLMTGSFTVGQAPAETTPTPKPGAPAATATKLVLTVTSRAVTLRTPAGKAVTSLVAGPALVTVRDRSARRGARLAGAGVTRSTGVGFVGTRTWKVTLGKGTLVYGSDARKPVLRGGRVPVS